MGGDRASSIGQIEIERVLVGVQLIDGPLEIGGREEFLGHLRRLSVLDPDNPGYYIPAFEPTVGCESLSPVQGIPERRGESLVLVEAVVQLDRDSQQSSR